MLSRMNDDLRKSLEERIRQVEDLWDSIAADQNLCRASRQLGQNG